jgi:hypothetical protein
MTQRRLILRRTIVCLTVSSAIGLAGLPSTAAVAASAEMVTPLPPLGDLSSFRAIVVNTTALVDKGDLVAAKARIKDLETSWDEAEPSLKPRAPADWHRLDKAIDRTLDALRESKPDQTICKQTLENLLTIMDRGGA